MESIIALLVLFILAVPVILIIVLVSLSSRLRDTTARLDGVTERLARAEDQLARIDAERPQAFRASTEPGQATSTVPVESAPVSLEPFVPAGWERESATPPLSSGAPEGAPAVPQSLDSLQTPPLVAEPVTPPMAQVENAAPPPLMVEEPPARPALAINWEQFMGAKLFAWVGGLALFLGMAFFVKYSFDRNLIPPELRVAIGFLTGIGLLVGGVLLKRKELSVTSQTLCATGVVTLYAVTFACRSFYHFSFFGPLPTFLLMVLITATAFALAVQLEAQVVAILGLLGGFLTPILLSTGEDNPLGLFSYIALLDVGLLGVAFRRRWHFLVAMGAVGTVFMQLGWAAHFFTVQKAWIAFAVFAGFDLLFAVGFAIGERLKQTNRWLSASAIGLPFVTLGFVFFLLSLAALGERPGVIFSDALAADLCLLGIVLLCPSLHPAHLAAGGVVFLALASWTGSYLTPSLLMWALALYLVFAILHAVFPIVLSRLWGDAPHTWVGHLFPPLALLLIFIPLLKEQTVSFLVWPAVLVVDALALTLALLTASALSVALVLFFTMALTAVWIWRIPAELSGLAPTLGVIAGFALLFFGAGLLLAKWLLTKPGEGEEATSSWDAQLTSVFGARYSSPELLKQIPAFAAILPFLLLIMVSTRLPLTNPSPVFGLATLLVVLLLGLAGRSGLSFLAPVSLGCVLALESSWHQSHFNPETARLPLLWYSWFYAIYTVFPFLWAHRFRDQILPWAVSALAGPLHFYLFYRVISLGYPTGYLGLLPAAFAVPMLLGLARIVRAGELFDERMRLNLMAWFGGSALFFITLVFPIQFERQWITIGWALEGLALVWLFQRVPHPGLRATGVVLLVLAFVRLALNPAVLEYHRNTSTRVFNWYLYAYGSVTVCLLLSARLLAPPRHFVWQRNVLPLLYSLGTILAFLLVNIEIADYFADGPTLTFQFSGSLARDMCYSIAWGLFGLVLLVIGIWKRLAAVRYAAIGLFVVTLLKLFFHDLSQLGQLYRIGAFLFVAIILIVASFLYQRFVAFEGKEQKLKA